MSLRLGLFTRLLDGQEDVYDLALAQLELAERLGYDSAWVAQHHFHRNEGGLPSPFVFLSYAAARTSRLRLGTGVVTLPHEQPIRVAEDAAVLDLLSGGRLELGVGTGLTPRSFAAFGKDFDDRGRIITEGYLQLVAALRGDEVGPGLTLQPDGRAVADRIWEATFGVEGGTRAGRAGNGLLLSRTQPKPDGASLADVQDAIVDAYLEALPDGVAPRIAASRSVVVAADGEAARATAAVGVRRFVEYARGAGQPVPTGASQSWADALDLHVGTPEQVTASLAADRVLARSTDLLVQVHPADPGQAATLESIELIARQVAPELGWVGAATAAVAR